jgi:hypothetical protein
MAQGDKGRVELNLKASICTDNPTGTDIYKPGDPAAKHVENTGIERQGGLTPIYEQETTFATAGADSIITASGDLLQVLGPLFGQVLLNNEQIGRVGTCTIHQRGVIPGYYLDAAWTTTATIIGIKNVGFGGFLFAIDEYDPVTGTIINTRTFIVAGMPATPYFAIVLVRYLDMKWADQQEIEVVTYTGACYIAKESTGAAAAQGVTNYIKNAHRFGASKYLLWGNGIVGNCYIGDTGAFTQLADVKYAIIDRFPGTAYSRAILTFAVYKNAANLLTGIAYVGYTIAGAWSATETYAGIALAAVTATITTPVVGPGYSECTYTRSDTGAAIYSYCAPGIYRHDAAAFYNNNSVASKVAINAYGKLTDIYGNLTGTTSVRVCMINGISGYLSVGNLSGTVVYDNLGVPLTNVGEFDDTYSPQIDDDNSTFTRIMYKFSGRMFFVDIRNTAAYKIYRVDDDTYQVNSISPFNIVSVKDRNLKLGVNDYNGRFFQDVATTSTRVVCLIQGAYSNSVDTGEKLTIGGLPPAALIPGIKYPPFLDLAIDYGVDIYINGVYSTTLIDVGVYKIDDSKVNTLYVSDTRLPIAMGYTYGERAVQTGFSTILTGVGVVGSSDVNYGYAGYELGNDITGTFHTFILFSQRYLFDGFNIYIAFFSGPIYTAKDLVCPAAGMTFIAASPTVAYFLSAFDNSIYTFDGGRSLAKLDRMNDTRNSSGVIEAITDGVFNVRDNTLLLQTASTFVWVRDGVVTQNSKNAGQTGISLYDTTDGIAIASNTKKWVYPYLDPGSSSIVPFSFKSAFFGPGADIMMVNTAFDVTIYSPTRETTSITITCDSLDADGASTQTEHLLVRAGDWSSLGLFRCRVRPAKEKVIAASIGVQCATKIVLTEISMEWTEDVPAVPANSRSV